MNYLIEFANNELIGFSVFIALVLMLCAAILLLIKLSYSTKYFSLDKDLNPPRPWPRSNCKCAGCAMVGGYQPCHNQEELINPSNNPDLDIKAPELKRGEHS